MEITKNWTFDIPEFKGSPPLWTTGLNNVLLEEFDKLEKLFYADEATKEAWGADPDLRHIVLLFFIEHKHPIKWATEDTFRRYIRLHEKLKRLSKIIP